MEQTGNKLIIITGPTAVGKTSFAIQLAQEFGTHILSCDSRQFYREMKIGVARPNEDELATAPHHFVACRSVTEPYNIFDYSRDAVQLLNQLFHDYPVVVACGGSGLYIDALLREPALLPDPPINLRLQLQTMSLEDKQRMLQEIDPVYYARVDLNNPIRLQRALEVSLVTGQPYSRILAEQQSKPRPFDIEVRVLHKTSDKLRQSINSRVDQMIADGLVDEVRSLLPFRHLPTLRTVGYRELFPVIDGTDTLEHAVEQIKLNTWHYAKKQMTWMRRYL